jgi:predicted ATPase
LGRIAARNGTRELLRFPSRAVAALLARLALHPARAHPREELIDLLWPGVALDVGRNRLRQTLSTLRSILREPGWPELIWADRLAVGVQPDALQCDVASFDAACRARDHAQAQAMYLGEFMPGYYDEWVQEERTRLAGLADGLAETLARAAASPPGRAWSPTSATQVTPQPNLAGAAEAAANGGRLRLQAVPLPLYPTRCFGLETPLVQLQERLAEERLVTLHGPGGSGKTRLAVEVARLLADEPLRVAFVALQGCESTEAVCAAVAQALRLPASAQAPETLAAALASVPTLLVLDNCEQLVGRLDALLAPWLARVAGLKVLATSRCVLGLDGECCVEAPLLPLPARGLTLAQALSNPAVALFVDRARAARSDFHLAEVQLAPVLEVLHALEGLPLAIELAASRVRSFAPAQMAAWLQAPLQPAAPAQSQTPRQLSLLARSGPRSGIDARHATMTQVIAASWRQLESVQVQALVAIARLPADAPLGAIGAAAALPEIQAADAVDGLVRQALLRAVEGPGGARHFHVLEPVREFALAQAADAAARDTRCRARTWLLQWARALGPYPPPRSVAEQANLLHALLAQAVADGDALQAAELGTALRAHWDTDGMPRATREAFASAAHALQAHEPLPHALLARLNELLAYVQFEAGDAVAANAAAKRAWTHAQASGEASTQAQCLVRLAWLQLAGERGSDGALSRLAEVEQQLTQALALARHAGDRDAQARALHQQAVLLTHHRDDWAGGEAALAQSQTLWEALGDERKARARLRNRAQCWVRLGQQDRALQAYRDCEQRAQQDEDWVGQIDGLISLSEVLSRQRQWASALDADRRCIALCWQRWHQHGLAYALWNPARSLAHLREPEASIRLMAFASQFWQARFGPLNAGDLRSVRGVQRLVRVQIGPARAAAGWEAGLALRLPQAVELALGKAA